MSCPHEPPGNDRANRRGAVVRPSSANWTDETLRDRIRVVVEDAGTPITVSKLADRLHGATGDDGYAEIHGALYRDHLQTLDAEGYLTFDMDTGLVYELE